MKSTCSRIYDRDITRLRQIIVALTAHAMKGDQERCLAAAMDGYPSPSGRESWMKLWPVTHYGITLPFRALRGAAAIRKFPIENTCTEGQIDDGEVASDDVAMSEVISATPRRSTRAFHRIRVQAQGRAHDRKKFKETCETVVVSAHGGLLLLKHEVDNGEMLVLTNPLTQEEQECRVVYLGEPVEKGQRVGIEFLTPAPRFWGVEFQDRNSTNNLN